MKSPLVVKIFTKIFKNEIVTEGSNDTNFFDKNDRIPLKTKHFCEQFSSAKDNWRTRKKTSFATEMYVANEQIDDSECFFFRGCLKNLY